VYEGPPPVHPLEEVAEHRFGDLEVGYDAVFQGADGVDVHRGAAEHALRFGADRQDRAIRAVHCDDGGLVEHDASAAHVHEGVRGAEVDADLARVLPQD